MRLIQLSAGGDDVDFVGTEEECRQVLEQYICHACYRDLVRMPYYEEYDYPLDDGCTIVRETLDDLLGTACGAEFMIEEDNP